MNNEEQQKLIFLQHLFMHFAGGTLGAFIFGGLLLYTDFNGLWTMMSRSQDGVLFFVMFFFGIWVTFASAAMGWGVFSLGQERDDPPNDRNGYY